ncbi:P-loop containing nucleoside triphosphate hydrolase protein [Mycena vitilis]|nr:P-loop containing nucleoside triphosphate hydrolase protein [Mycena vitilis]
MRRAQRNQDSFMQTLLDGVESKLELKTKHESDLERKFLSVFAHAGPIGIAPGYSKSGGLVALAIADDTYCLIVQFYSNSGNSAMRTAPRGRGGGRRHDGPPKERDTTGRKLLEEIILCRAAGDLLAFDFGPLCMSLYCGVDLRVTNGIDIQSAFSAVDRKPLSAIKDAVGDSVRVFEDNVIAVFENPIYDPDHDPNCVSDLAMRAWISQYLITIGNGAETFTKVAKINTKALETQTLNILAKMTQDSLRLGHIKPSETKHGFTTTHDVGGLGVSSDAYKTHFRRSQNVVMSVQNSSGSAYTLYGQTGGVDGRRANLSVGRPLDNTKTILSIKTIGRDDPTTAEAQRAAAVLRILQGNLGLLTDNPWMQNIWFPKPAGESGDIELLVWPQEWTVSRDKAASSSPAPSGADNLDRQYLNKSQREAVDTMLSRSDTHRITIIQGPPGTGKTSVIAAYVKGALQAQQSGIWLIAKSNVAVINIGSKLMAAGFNNWCLLASKEFAHTDWHGHLYEGIQAHFIRSDEFRTMPMSRIKGCKVILCTLSMLSSRWLSKFTNQIPVNTIVVDEASQIEIGDYIPVFTNFPALRKMCFIGDDKQLPPYGQEDLQDLQSIFEITHLRRLCLFLDTQYRMPPQIGSFISSNVYNGQLNSNPKHPISEAIIACQFVDVVGSKEQIQITGTSIVVCGVFHFDLHIFVDRNPPRTN